MKNYTYPTLTGSQKQIAWASDIRKDFITEYYEMMSKPAKEENHTKALEAQRDAVIEMLLKHTDSDFWIDNRSLPGTCATSLLTRKERKEANRIFNEVYGA